VLTPPGLSTSGPGVTVPGTDVQVALDPDGRHLDVFERVLLPAPTSDPLSLATVVHPDRGVDVQVSDLQVQLDDALVPAAADGPGSWRADAPAGSPYTRATLRYRLDGAVVAKQPAAPGRVIGYVTPLSGLVSAQSGKEVQVRAIGDDVLGVTCQSAVDSVCGTRGKTGWTALVPTGARPIVVSLTLTTR
jgi:hypothetical protein